MDFYERWILPPILDVVMRRKDSRNTVARRSLQPVAACSKLGWARD